MTVDVRAVSGDGSRALRRRSVVAEGSGKGRIVDAARNPDTAVAVRRCVRCAPWMALGAAGGHSGRVHVGPVVPRETARTYVPVGTVDGPVISRSRRTV